MASPTPSSKTGTDVQLDELLETSFHISVAAPLIKPFVRFSSSARQRPARDGLPFPRRFWDFDDLLQKRLLRLVYTIATPEQIVQACVRRWQPNLASLYERRMAALEIARRGEGTLQFSNTPRLDFVASRLRPASRLVYIGCGAGSECFVLAQKGLQVVGIDTLASLLEPARGWAEHLLLQADFACMDVMTPGFQPASFDAFLLEFYGSYPAASQIAALQYGLASLLRPGGLGFISANRKRYASHWQRMSNPYPPAVLAWLHSFPDVDFIYDQADACEERLIYGLYNRSHTIESLSDELHQAFDVVECFYEDDPRYLMAVVRPLAARMARPDNRAAPPVRADTQAGLYADPAEAIRQARSLCEDLETLVQAVSACLEGPSDQAGDKLEAVASSARFSAFLDALETFLSQP